ncbi:MAG: PhzF family phenazine biosynthesis protein [Thalassobaculum sp.]|uniref:PhzF family phenazine biosynthesis protein n=1 Tax=Thalassobaculum sp. TaxID=2022740 RepID=UPI0032EF24F7
MRVPIYQVDAFTDRLFAGNPAAVVVLDTYPDDARLQDIAAENNLAETAFLCPDGDDWSIRWFTPTIEVPLCGHATLASSWVVLTVLQPDRPDVRFRTRQSGDLVVRRDGAGFVMDFPANPPVPAEAPSGLARALGIDPVAVLATPRQYIAVLESAGQVRSLRPDPEAIAELDRRGVVVTAPGDRGYDCVSRYFAPRDGIPEDPVTGGVHCALAPYWCDRLGKTEILANQASARGGEILCRLRDGRVELQGRCTPYLEGRIEIDR